MNRSSNNIVVAVAAAEIIGVRAVAMFAAEAWFMAFESQPHRAKLT
jgi:hypothetical protein